ncbi:hypothetical protein KIH39_09165 [Telmatocola sphagniphila]|uniref:DUF2092 domain-containing protein n=1 Tax=Telmatocola sphagniphila TaxID=1123043 RepID=A0A8E6EWR2_9BACT|nr:hypothetical protein [Telmatocola sphagniphila]QVL34057.1 hypothetical protein KIH39_09165 [Telmatocola sphagniphila]
MNERNEIGSPDILDQAIEAVQSLPIPEAPPATLFSSIAIPVHNQQIAVQSRKNRQRKIRHYIGLAAVGSIAAALVIILSLGGQNTAFAFSQAVEKVKRAGSVRYRVKTTSPMADQIDEVTIRDKQVQVKTVGPAQMAWLIDWEQAGLLILNGYNKTYQTVDLAARTGAIAPFDTMSLNLRDQLEELIRQKPVFEQSENIASRTTFRYAITDGTALGLKGDWLVWLDSKTHYPVRIRVCSQSQSNSIIREYSNFDWNPQIPADAFQFDPPSDYREQQIFQTIPPLAPWIKKK